MKFASPFRYPGGKTRLAIFLSKVLAKSKMNIEKFTLVEPYAGGAGASLKLLYLGVVNKIIINDLDKAIYSFWRVAVSDSDYLINKIKRVNIDIDEWKKQKQIYNNPSSSMKKLAFATLFLNRTNRSGIITGGPIGGKSQSGLWHVRSRFNKDIIIERLRKIKEYRAKIVVKNLDGINLLKKLEINKSKNKYFIFLDPPYYRKGKSLYLNHYTNKDHEKLSKYLEKSPLKWIMTYDDVAFIRSLYNNFRKSSFVINHSAYKTRQGKEIMIFSDNVVKVALR